MVSTACAQNSLTSKDIVNKWGGSVVQVRMAAKFQCPMGESDSREELVKSLGMIDPSSLTVVSAMATNPVASLQDLIERGDQRSIRSTLNRPSRRRNSG